MVSLEEKEIRAKVRAEEENQKREEFVKRSIIVILVILLALFIIGGGIYSILTYDTTESDIKMQEHANCGHQCLNEDVEWRYQDCLHKCYLKYREYMFE